MLKKRVTKKDGGEKTISEKFEDPVRYSGIPGVEAVIDKDLASSVLAKGIGCQKLIILTDVKGALAIFICFL